MKMTPERVVVVTNPASSRASRVPSEVAQRLGESLSPHQLFPLETPSTDSYENIDWLSERLMPGDNVIVAAGDGTGNAVINADLQSRHDGVRVGFLPYGNFNDMAATFTDRAARRDPLRLLQEDPIDVYPLQVLKNKEHYRYALLYATLGWTASAAALFDRTDVQRTLPPDGSNLVMSLGHIAQMYFRVRGISQLPAFTRDGHPEVHTATTDVLAINGPIMAKIIRSNRHYYTQPEFLSTDLNVSGIVANIPFLGRSGLNLFGLHQVLPGVVRREDTLQFSGADVPLQVEGEYSLLRDVESLTIAKDTAHSVSVMRSASLS